VTGNSKPTFISCSSAPRKLPTCLTPASGLAIPAVGGKGFCFTSLPGDATAHVFATASGACLYQKPKGHSNKDFKRDITAPHRDESASWYFNTLHSTPAQGGANDDECPSEGRATVTMERGHGEFAMQALLLGRIVDDKPVFHAEIDPYQYPQKFTGAHYARYAGPLAPSHKAFFSKIGRSSMLGSLDYWNGRMARVATPYLEVDCPSSMQPTHPPAQDPASKGKGKGTGKPSKGKGKGRGHSHYPGSSSSAGDVQPKQGGPKTPTYGYELVWP
jgi:hypothetical protein